MSAISYSDYDEDSEVELDPHKQDPPMEEMVAYCKLG